MNVATHTKPSNSPVSASNSDLPIEGLSDEQLVAQYCSTSDRDFFACLVSRYERELYTYLRRYLNDAEMAEDAFQAAFLQVHLKREQFEEGRKFRPWLYAIATNQAIDAQRRNKRHRMVSLDRSGSEENQDVGVLVDMLVSDDQDPFDQVNAMERKEQMLSALEDLPEHLRSVVHLVYYQGLKYREAADVLAVPVGTVKSRLHAAIVKLTEFWNDKI
ncbi:RNA polymerase sigma factor [Lignipirellula cremea]|uniref:ECF RNA polymerase sigma factor SigW n=1 Tax=Lignipirellula cremea TaxID=2528010 RepID=A0A518E4P1_9BACT|nr:sigma-70 family RNA polymerase sigma factor [Lignipirellula cremea]QDU99065.1 ECF RNA polymerase sigma factor SigW [Lignipirellula cremea]